MAKRPFPIISRRLRIAVWIAAIVGPLASVMAFYNYYRDRLLLEHGTRAPATINSIERMPSTKGREIYHFDISWRDEAANKKYRKTFSTSSARWPQGPPEGSTTVIYLPDAPHRSEIADSFRPDIEPIVLGIFFAVAGAIAVVWLRYSTRKNLEWLQSELNQCGLTNQR